MFVGILAALTAGAMWGLTFVAPRAVDPFGVFDLAIARNVFFGLASICLLFHPAFRPTTMTVKQILLSISLGMIGYVGIFLSIAFSVRFAGVAIPPLIVGLVPIVLAVIGNWTNRDINWQRLAFPLLLIGVGAFVINFWTFYNTDNNSSRLQIALGAGFAFLAVGFWTLYGVINANVMGKPGSPNALPWTVTHGFGALLGTIPILLIGAATGSLHSLHHSLITPEGQNFLFWALLTGLGGSWVAAWTWAVASRLLPLTLTGQLLVSEAVFGLVLGLIYENRLPNLAEFLGASLMILGIVLAIRTFMHLNTSNRDEDRLYTSKKLSS